MKKREKILLICVIIIFVLGMILIGLNIFKNKNVKQNDIENNNIEKNNDKKESYVEQMEDGTKINKNKKLNEAKKIDGLTITNIQLTTKDGMTTLLADVINNSNVKTKLKTVDIVLLDKNGKELTKLVGIINALEVGATTQLNISMTSDYVNAYDFKVLIK